MANINERLKSIMAMNKINPSDRKLYDNLEIIYESDLSKDCVFLWILDNGQSLFFKERNLFIIGSSEYENLALYGSIRGKEVISFLVRVDLIDGKIIYGEIIEVNLKNYYKHVKELAVPISSYSYRYESGFIYKSSEVIGNENGLFKCFEPVVLNEPKLDRILCIEHQRWDNCRKVEPNYYISGAINEREYLRLRGTICSD